jgi:hypothetical protein
MLRSPTANPAANETVQEMRMDEDGRRRALLEAVTQKLRQLSEDEIASLIEAAKGPLAPTISEQHSTALIDADLATQALGGLMLTDLGRAAADVARDRRR